MARVGQVLQQPAEVRFYTLDYSEFLDIAAGEALTGTPTTEVTPTTDPVLTVTPTIISTYQIRLVVAGGADGSRYNLETRVETNLGQLKEDELIVAVRDV